MLDEHLSVVQYFGRLVIHRNVIYCGLCGCYRNFNGHRFIDSQFGFAIFLVAIEVQCGSVVTHGIEIIYCYQHFLILVLITCTKINCSIEQQLIITNQSSPSLLVL